MLLETERSGASTTSRSLVGLQVPAGPEELASHYDLTLSHPYPNYPPFAAFDRWLSESAAEQGLSCGLIHDGVVQEAIRRLSLGQLAIGFHLDYFAQWHIASHPYARLAQAVQDAGGHSVNLPARARIFTDKASMQGELARRGLGTPETVLVRPWLLDRPLTAAEQQRLSLSEPDARVYVKPAKGYNGLGVVRVENATPDRLSAALLQARQYDPYDTLLIQREIRPPLLLGEDGLSRPAYWRLLYCLGEWTMFWWQPAERLGDDQPSYRLVTASELRRHRLQPVLDYGRDLAELSGLEWFSTELCLSEGAEVSRHTVPGLNGRDWPVLAIDYLNDQCDVEVRSRSRAGLPDDVVRRIARRFAEAAWRVRQQAIRPESVHHWRTAA
jgi:hypothetical protein